MKSQSFAGTIRTIAAVSDICVVIDLEITEIILFQKINNLFFK